MKKHLKQLQNIVNLGKLGHAYLFFGASPKELSDFSFEFAKMLLGENIEQNLDFLLIEVKEEKEIKVEAIRDLINFLSLSSSNASYKVAVINNAEKMNKNASNALLKVLEEPSLGKVIILTADNTNMLFPTILSRVQKINLFTNNKKYVTLSKKEFGLFKKLTESDIAEKLNIAEKIAKGENTISVLESWTSFFHDIFYIKHNLNNFVKNEDYLKELKSISENYSDQKLQDILRDLIKTINLLKTTNVNVRLALENFVINI